MTDSEGQMAHVNIDGPAGLLEARLERQLDGDDQRGAILCHPHPQYGGSMDDLVLEAISVPLLSAGFSVLRFNFRGVGHSAGQHDNGVGEVEDIMAVAAWMAEAGYSPLTLCGYSFGAVMALQAAARQAFHQLLLVAPPVAMMSEKPLPTFNTTMPVLVVSGEQDQFVPADDLPNWFSAPSTVKIVQHADHFFHGYHHQLSDIVAEVL